MNRVKLQFMVVPEELAEKAYVPDPVKIRITDPEKIFLLGLLGESGRELVRSGIAFYFEGTLARQLIETGVAEEIE